MVIPRYLAFEFYSQHGQLLHVYMALHEDVLVSETPVAAVIHFEGLVVDYETCEISNIGRK